ncbi:MAG: DUF86 domain-containing protein [Chloroflexota bacterium]|nr:DUF86 domain-containing protein [Chloroflexota bacterium]
MRTETAKRLLDALSATREIQDFVEGRSLDDYLNDRKLQLPVERLLEIVGEALNIAVRLDANLVDSITDLRRFVDLRNRIIHAYDSVDGVIVWNIVERYVPLLIIEIEHYLDHLGNFSKDG